MTHASDITSGALFFVSESVRNTLGIDGIFAVTERNFARLLAVITKTQNAVKSTV